MKTIKQLRQSGWKVRVMHTRNFETASKISGVYKFLSNSGGRTYIQVTSPEGINTEGTAVCPDDVNFNRKLGNCIALGRALHQYNKLNK
jgi:hypothetical protein